MVENVSGEIYYRRNTAYLSYSLSSSCRGLLSGPISWTFDPSIGPSAHLLALRPICLVLGGHWVVVTKNMEDRVILDTILKVM